MAVLKRALGCGLILLAGLALVSCGGSSGSGSGTTTTTPRKPRMNWRSPSDGGPSGDAINTLYTTVTICVPGTTTCQTIDNIQVDTGSYGLRVLASVLTLSLPVAIGDEREFPRGMHAIRRRLQLGPCGHRRPRGHGREGEFAAGPGHRLFELYQCAARLLEHRHRRGHRGDIWRQWHLGYRRVRTGLRRGVRRTALTRRLSTIPARRPRAMPSAVPLAKSGVEPDPAVHHGQ
jgi:hypothetical protein